MAETGRRAVFLDLNGTLVLPLRPDRLDELALMPGTAEAVARLSAAGFAWPVVTWQSRIAKGFFSGEEFEAWFVRLAASLASSGAHVVGPYVCPHRFAEPCACKKPSTLLYERAALEHGIAAGCSFVIGDSPEDMAAAQRLGTRGCLVRTGWAADPSIEGKGAPLAHFVADSIEEAVVWVLSADAVG